MRQTLRLRLTTARAATMGLVAFSASACMDAPVVWQNPVSLPMADSSVAWRLGFDSAGQVSVNRPVPASMPADPRACQLSVRTVTLNGHTHSAWWSVRDDSTALLLASSSADSGKQWHAPMVVDSLDRARVGCGRPAPSIAASTSGVSVAYSMRAPEGTGVFFSHLMTAEGAHAMFHSPVIVVYGDRVVPVAVAADGELVAVAYEDPSARHPRIDVALSDVMGHRFDHRVIVATSDVVAGQPDVALDRRRVAVAWRRPSGGFAVRVGEIR
jgi:hypothetical protein